MQFHYEGYSTGDPLQMRAEGSGINRPKDLPETMDVLIVGAGPAGTIAAAQLSRFPGVVTRLVERRGHRLELANADGVHSRTIETFQAFGFAHEILAEAHEITDMAFWKPNPENPDEIIRDSSTRELPQHISEFPMALLTQTRIIDHFNRFMKNSPTRMEPDYGYEFIDFTVAEDADNANVDDYPVSVTLRRTSGEREGEEVTVRTKYLVGADGARSQVRKSLGYRLEGKQANHAWGVMDIHAHTDFPDVRKKCTIKFSVGRTILLIPREGGYLFRLYVDLGEVPDDGSKAVRATPLEDVIATANSIMAPYTVEVKNVVWHSIYEVGHRVADHFDDRVSEKTIGEHPRIFIAGDACHTHSAKAGQGMNVSMQDGFNLGWKLGHVASGNSPRELLRTYAEEREDIAYKLIDYDKNWSSLMAKPSSSMGSAQDLENFYRANSEFNAGYMTQYEPSSITMDDRFQHLAEGFPIGRRFKSAIVGRVCDFNELHLGHQATADGRVRAYVFADSQALSSPDSALHRWARWAQRRLDPTLIDAKVTYQDHYTTFDISVVPAAFQPKVGIFELTNVENAFGVTESRDIFDERGLSRNGVVVVVRPDQYVSAVFPLDDTEGLEKFLAGYFPG
ncbi:3-hydroxybenzoate 4-monooxygenase [Corynebacterium yudongzhengii]|uniref:3-hydroxybenzoate 4-monooxygenase n=1 Tax=Corynebacterium yudongzhengii TaxID=2080740 RepID=A0A2U1T5Z3_9CORY|nr:FAD-dependent monooxygenase [Corynebacterium yudongzhengii]AWB81978.1 3-hydroxybenzoate 4-monooxygenase [Corynebacterium yudongzhengii]PWC01440.1 3-hydroxybenzoate 4-monooxygenase [Corynebacterium yudongzhengii]